MKFIIRKVIKFFFNFLWKIKAPESVQYWKWSDSARAKVMEGEDGSLQMRVEGEKHPLYGFPRGHVLTGSLSKLKHTIKNEVFNQIFEKIEKMYEEFKFDVIPIEKCAPSIREMAKVFDKLEHMEIQDDMKGRIRLIKKVLLWFLQEDDAYRFRAMAFLQMIDQKKVALTKADLYFARGKYWKPDMYKKMGGIWWDAYDY